MSEENETSGRFWKNIDSWPTATVIPTAGTSPAWSIPSGSILLTGKAARSWLRVNYFDGFERIFWSDDDDDTWTEVFPESAEWQEYHEREAANAEYERTHCSCCGRLLEDE